MSPEDIEDQAIAWHVRLNDASATGEERAAFDRWLLDSPDHAEAFDKARDLWDLAGEAAPALGAGGWYRPGRWRFARLPSFASWMAPVPALAALAVALIWHDPSLLARLGADYAAPPGPVRAVDMADGSHLLLEGGAAVDVALGADRRLVTVKRGKVWFDVSHTGVPFEVASDKLDVRVVGTAFSVEGGTVEVERGTVRVAASAEAKVATVTAGQRARLGEDQDIAVDGFDPALDLAWRRDLVVFDRASLAEVAARLEHVRAGRVVVIGEDLRRETLSGTFSAGSPEVILSALSESMGVKRATLPGFLTVLYR